MNLDNIKQILEISGLPNGVKERLIITELSKDPQVIPKVLEILSAERVATKSLVGDANLQISRFVAAARHPRLVKKDFLIEEARKFYEEHDQIKPCYNLEGFPGYRG